jgi:hypothetical protein
VGGDPETAVAVRFERGVAAAAAFGGGVVFGVVAVRSPVAASSRSGSPGGVVALTFPAAAA